jgi:hypothetical protein
MQAVAYDRSAATPSLLRTYCFREMSSLYRKGMKYAPTCRSPSSQRSAGSETRSKLMTTNAGTPGFAHDIKPLFREFDRDEMDFIFDLWDYKDVSNHAEDILERLTDGSMPCDEEWPEERIDLFRRWIEGGKPA